MPIFKFQCLDKLDIHKPDLHIFEELIFSDKDIMLCPTCKSECIKLFTPTSNIAFNGNGWTQKSNNYTRYDTTSAIKDQIKELKNSKENYTTEQLFNPNGDKKL